MIVLTFLWLCFGFIQWNPAFSLASARPRDALANCRDVGPIPTVQDAVIATRWERFTQIIVITRASKHIDSKYSSNLVITQSQIQANLLAVASHLLLSGCFHNTCCHRSLNMLYDCFVGYMCDSNKIYIFRWHLDLINWSNVSNSCIATWDWKQTSRTRWIWAPVNKSRIGMTVRFHFFLGNNVRPPGTQGKVSNSILHGTHTP